MLLPLVPPPDVASCPYLLRPFLLMLGTSRGSILQWHHRLVAIILLFAASSLRPLPWVWPLRAKSRYPAPKTRSHLPATRMRCSCSTPRDRCPETRLSASRTQERGSTE